MDKQIVITSINEPTRAVREFAALPDYKLIVVGDRKTPADWQQEGVQFLDLAAQTALCRAFADTLPVDHYVRKMVGYIQAMQNGAQVIVDTDDDNIPYEGWSFPGFDDRYDLIRSQQPFVNIYALYTDHPIWPRGLPLTLVKQDAPTLERQPADCRVGVWQGLADLEPDVDAIYRLTCPHPEDFRFDPNGNMVLAAGTFTPFNSQNTAFRSECFPLLYLPGTVTFRYSDILRSYVAQPIMARHGFQLGLTQASVFQLRNPHNLMEDFRSEIPVYLDADRVVGLVGEALQSQSMADNLLEAYSALERANIVTADELICLHAWLDLLASQSS